MATDFIDGLRSANFPTERRGGYSPQAVDSYLGELADWLETGGGDQTRAALVQRDMERVGERTGTILSAAQESADRIEAEARAEAAQLRDEAAREAAELRSSADAYATATRGAADEHVRVSAEAATREAAELRTKTDGEVRAKIGRAEDLLHRSKEEAAARTAGVEQTIADLNRTRMAILANLEELASGLRVVVEGPGAEEIELPERIEAASAAAKVPELEPVAEDPVEAETVGEHRVVEPTTEKRALAEEGLAETEPLEEEELAETEPVEADLEEEPTRVFDADFDTDEREQARERELIRRRNPKNATEQPTEDSSLTDLL